MGEGDDGGGGLDLGISGDDMKEQQDRAEQAREQQDQETEEPESDSSEAEGSSEEATEETESQQSDPEPKAEEESAGASSNGESSGTSDQSNQNSSSQNSSEDDELLPVKEREQRILAYVPPSIGDKWKLAVTQLQLTWQRDGNGKELSKLRHIYPILLDVGADNVDDLTGEEIAEKVEQIEEEDRETL